MSKFILFDKNRKPIGLLQNDISVIWLENYQTQGEVKITARATPANNEYLQDGVRIYNTERNSVARISQIEIIENGEEVLIEARADLTAEILSDRVVMATENVRNVEAGMYAIYRNNRRGLPVEIAAPVGYIESTDTEITGISVLEAETTLALSSGLGFIVDFNPETGIETFRVYRGTDRSDPKSAHYVGYLGTDVGNIYNVHIVSGTANFKNVAVVAGEGEGMSRIVHTAVLGGAAGEERREMYVDAKDLRRILHLEPEEVVAKLKPEWDAMSINIRVAEGVVASAQTILTQKEQASTAALTAYNNSLAQISKLEAQLAALQARRQVLTRALQDAQQSGDISIIARLLVEIAVLDMDIGAQQDLITAATVQANAALQTYQAAEAARAAADVDVRNAQYVLSGYRTKLAEIEKKMKDAAEGNGEDIEMPMGQYLQLLNSRGLEKLAEQLEDFSISCEVSQNNIIYNEDYFLGDRLPVKLSSYGIAALARVASAQTEYENTGERVNITLDDFKMEDLYGHARKL